MPFAVGCDVARQFTSAGTRDAMERCISAIPRTPSGRMRGSTIRLRWSGKIQDYRCIYSDIRGHVVAIRRVPR